jgi:small subunit ribosomal protein S4
MIRKHKIYSKPRKAYDSARIAEENRLVARYGLKNKREIWKADAAIDNIRNQAKNLITASGEEQEKLINKLNKMGFKVEKIADILALKEENWLKRRLQSIVVEKQIAKTPKAARQLIAHKHISVSENIINIPSYLVHVNEEDKISVVGLKTKEMRKAEKIKGVKNGGE